jgi:inorganic pyrophosphatase
MPKDPVDTSTCFSLSSYDGNYLNAVIETPMGSHAKYSYDPATRLFKLSTILPAGAVFPYNFGFVPSTRGADGDPLDVLVMMDAAAHPGCLIPSLLIGVIEAEQTEKNGKSERNDRLIAVASHCPTYGQVQSIDELCGQLVAQIEYFFVAYNKVHGKKFKPLGRHGPKRAQRLVQLGIDRFEQRLAA